jgi:predicted Zn-dependent protease
LSIDYMIANHYDPLAAVRLHRKFLKIDPSLRLPFLSSHPSGEERIRNLKAVIEEKQQQSTSKGSAEAKEMQEGGGERK